MCYNNAMKGRISAVLDPSSVDLISHSPTHTIRIGGWIGSLLQPGDLVLLFGTFGVGKTHFTKGLCEAFGVDQADVTSPTFVLVNNYTGDRAHDRQRINHIDLYRLEGETTDFNSIGLEELWDTDAVCIVEWAERLDQALPADYLAIQIDHLSETKRLLRITPHGEHYRQLVEQLRAIIAGK